MIELWAAVMDGMDVAAGCGVGQLVPTYLRKNIAGKAALLKVGFFVCTGKVRWQWSFVATLVGSLYFFSLWWWVVVLFFRDGGVAAL